MVSFKTLVVFIGLTMPAVAQDVQSSASLPQNASSASPSIPTVATTENPSQPVATPVSATTISTSTPASATTSRQEPSTNIPAKANSPVSARQYLEAGAKLHNKGRYELAAKYLKAAYIYRNTLTPNELIVLGVYQEKVNKQIARLNAPPIVPKPERVANFPENRVKFDPSVTMAGGNTAPNANNPEPGSAPPIDDPFAATADGFSSVDPADATLTENSTPGSESKASAGNENDPLRKLYGTETWRNSTNSKQRGRWMLQLAREQILLGHFEKAREILDHVRTMDVVWSYFDDNPQKVAETLAKAEDAKRNGSDGSAKSSARGRPSPAGTTPLTFDRKTAKARLREARAALDAGEVDQAEAIANEVKSWRIGFYFFDDTPDKVFTTIDSVKRRRGLQPGAASRTKPSDTDLATKPVDDPDTAAAALGHSPNYLKGTRFDLNQPAAEPVDLPR